MTQPPDNPAPPPLPAVPDPWREVTWEGHRQAQLERWAQLPFSKKLEWLEEAHLLSLAFRKANPLPAAPPQIPSHDHP